MSRAVDLCVEDHAAGRGQDDLLAVAVLDRVVRLDLLRVQRHLDLLLRGD